MTEVAARQHGVIARWQLVNLGLTRHQIAHLVATGWLHPVFRAVFAVGHRQISQEGHWLAAVLAGGDGAILSHCSGTSLWRILPPARGVIHVTAPAKRRDQDGLRIHVAHLEPHEIRTRNRIPVTSPERTLLDIAATSARHLDKAIREAIYLRLVSPSSLVAAVHRYAGRPGCKALRKAADEADLTAGPTKEELEHRFRRFIKRHRVPVPRFNAPLRIDGIEVHPDCLWSAHRLVVELDSAQAHLNRRAFEADRARDRALQVAGYRVIRITWRQLDDDPEQIASHLSAILLG
ncbi:MAG: DUF559 domain-containing protein [Thermoleophilaceae bacterium]